MVLMEWRFWLRTGTNPKTNAAFTEAEIGRALAKGSRWWIGAQAIDVVCQVAQARSMWLADQALPDTASTEWGRRHAALWLDQPDLLEATGSVGTVTTQTIEGVVYVGSAVPGDPAAHYLSDPLGRRFQVLYSATATAPDPGTPTTIELVVWSLEGGSDTNWEDGTVFNWEFAPPFTKDQATAVEDFSRGTDRETDAERARRVQDAIRHKQGAGNWSQFRGWSRTSSNAIEDGFVYPCGLWTGSVVVSPTQKRARARGPEARIPSTLTVDLLRAFLVPPGSAVVPGDPVVLVVAPESEPSDVELGLSMLRRSDAGWTDGSPWPTYESAVPVVTNVGSSTVFRISADTAPPSSSGVHLMVWDTDTSRWEELVVTSIVAFGGGEYTVTLAAAPKHTVALGDVVSPNTRLSAVIAEAIEAYFDTLGPGEIVEPTDVRSGRAYRNPIPSEQWPQNVTAGGMALFLSEALGLAVDNFTAPVISVTTPTIPDVAEDGPRMITLGKLGIFAL